jgi:hypothetical protein
MLDPKDLKSDCQVFTYLKLGAAEPWHIATGRIEEDLQSAKLVAPKRMVVFSVNDVNQIVRQNGVEMHRVLGLSPKQLEVPIQLLGWDSGHHTLIDGNHRVVARALQGRLETTAFLLTEAQVREYLVDPAGFKPMLVQELEQKLKEVTKP